MPPPDDVDGDRSDVESVNSLEKDLFASEAEFTSSGGDIHDYRFGTSDVSSVPSAGPSVPAVALQEWPITSSFCSASSIPKDGTFCSRSTLYKPQLFTVIPTSGQILSRYASCMWTASKLHVEQVVLGT